jgi:hypothetical protein
MTVSEIVIIFNCYVVKATQLTTIVTLYPCNNITLKMAAITTETFCETVVNKIHHKYCSEFFVCILWV